MSHRRVVASLLACALLGVLGLLTGSPPALAADALRFSFPAADVVYPEGIAYHAGNGDFFVGSTANGAVYRGSARGAGGQLQLFLPGGSDGRTDVRGMKVNPQGQLFLAGGATGTMWMYDAVTGRLLSSFANGVGNSFVNDVAIAPDGAAYFTDSNVPILYRIKPDAEGVFRLEYWRDLRGTAIEYGQGFNLNGIAVTPDNRYLIVVQSNTGRLFRITIESKEVSEIALAGGDRMTGGDGLLLDGQILHVVRNNLGLIVQLRLANDFGSGQQVGSFTDPSFAFPTTIASSGRTLLVVNSQFNRRQAGNPVLPFTVSGVPIPIVR